MAHAALVTASGIGDKVLDVPAVLPAEAEEAVEGHSLADTAGHRPPVRDTTHGLVGRMSSSLTSARPGSWSAARIVSATSSGRRIFSGTEGSNGWLASIPVSTEPGHSAMTRMLFFRSSSISDLLKPRTACFEAT